MHRVQTARRFPFQNLKAENWLNLALAALVAFYVFYIVWEALQGTLCGQLGVDYCDYWSAGRAANLYGYPSIYDLPRLSVIQHGVLPAAADPAQFMVVPFLYLPVFVLPFQLLALLKPQVGFWIWSAANILALSLYLRYFARRLNLQLPSVRLMLVLGASLPAFLNLFSGQVSVWMAICVGEFIRAALNRRPMTAGLWLGGLLIKPQILILFALLLLLHRSFRILAGLLASALVVILTSVALIGPAGMQALLRLWASYGGSQSDLWVEGMMNWRMLGYHASALVGPWIAYGLAAAGMLVTAGIVIYAWRRPFDTRSASVAVATLGIFAATTLATWHSQIHMAMVLIPPMLYLRQTDALSQEVVDGWAILPGILFALVVFAPGVLARLQFPADGGARFIYFFVGASQFAANAYLLGWSVRRSARLS